MIFIDRKYILLISNKLENFKQVRTDLYNLRCPYCGDSAKIKSKARGYIFRKSEKYFYICHNCGIGTSFKKFLEFVDPFLSKEYSLENFKERLSESKISITKKPAIPKFERKIIDLPTIVSLDDEHFAKQYIIKRKIPECHWKNLFFAENFKEFVESISEKRYGDNNDFKKPRIIIPFINRTKQLVAFQGRALDDFSVRYFTVKLLDEPKIFGANSIDITKDIFVVEGPIDSLFLNNCIATADSNLAFAEKVFKKEQLILIPDIQPRNKDLCRQIEKFVDSNFRVCLLPDSLPGKDVNDWIKNGLSKEELYSIIVLNTFQGLRAKIEFIKWRKC